MDGRGGGVLLYSNLSNISSSTTKLQTKFHQILAVKLTQKNEADVNLHLVYRSPNSSDVNNDCLLTHISALPENTILLGDFNCREINWETLTVNSSEDSFSQRFLDTCQDKFLQQSVNFPTNYTPQKDGTITKTCIDLILTDNPELIASVRSTGHLGKSNHVILEALLKVPSSQNDSTELVPDFRKADFKELRNSLLLVQWENDLNPLSTVESWEFFKQQINKRMEDSIPKKRRRISNRPLWMNQNIMRVIRKKRRVWKWYCTTTDYEDYMSYKKVCATVSKTVRKAKRKLERKLAKNIKSNPKAFYKYMNSNMKSRSKVGPLKDHNGDIQTEDSVMTGILNDAFTSVFTVEDTTKFPAIDQVHQGTPLDNIVVNSETVFKKIEKLDPSKTPGPDKFHPRFIKELGDVLCIPLAIIFRKSLEEGVVPMDWRNANVTSIFKKGDRTLASNYRPISLTSIICKMLESLIKDAVMKHLLENHLVHSAQHGFIPSRS